MCKRTSEREKCLRGREGERMKKRDRRERGGGGGGGADGEERIRIILKS